MVQKFMENGIECRPIVAGNFLNNPVMKTHSISYQKTVLIQMLPILIIMVYLLVMILEI